MYRGQSRLGPVPPYMQEGARVTYLQIRFLLHSLFDHSGAIAPDDYPFHINDRNRPLIRSFSTSHLPAFVLFDVVLGQVCAEGRDVLPGLCSSRTSLSNT